MSGPVHWPHRRVKPAERIRPRPPAQLAPYQQPRIPPGKFTAVPGQLAMDLDSDDPDALVDPATGEPA